jgi:UV DNA damage endonuclease
MKIGYPCLNRSIGCTPGRTFRLRSYSARRLAESVRLNLECLGRILEFNTANGLLFFRITSDLVPFASHPVCAFPWHEEFAQRFASLGEFIRHNEMRISMHPDQFTLINSPDPDIFSRSAAELDYHARILDLLGLDRTARIQIHVGGVYGDKAASIDRFCLRFERLDRAVRRRLVVENDDRQYSVSDCLLISRRTGTPVLFDSFPPAEPGRKRNARSDAIGCGHMGKRRRPAHGRLQLPEKRRAQGQPRGEHRPEGFRRLHRRRRHP